MEQNGPGSWRDRSSIRNRESAPGMIPFEYYDRATRDNLDRPPPSMPRVHQRRDREPVVRDPRLLPLVEVPALLARETMARERGFGRMLELHVDHDDRGGEDALVRVLDGAGGVENLPADHHVVDPDLPQLAAAVVHVRVRDAPRLLVDEEDALAEGVLRELGDALDHVHAALLPHLVEGPVDPVVPLDREVPAVRHREQVPLAEIAPVHPGDVAGVAAVAV